MKLRNADCGLRIGSPVDRDLGARFGTARVNNSGAQEKLGNEINNLRAPENTVGIFSHEGTKVRRHEGKGKGRARTILFPLLFAPRSQSPDWECTCLRNSVSTSVALLLASVLSAHAQLLMPPASQPAASPTPQLAPIAPPVPVFPYPLWMVITAASVALLLVAGIVWAIVRHLKNRPQPTPPTPRELALAALEALQGRITELEPYPFSIEVSDVLRRFVVGEFRVAATQQTSPEFLAAAAASPRFNHADKSLLAAFLDKVDLIKFARVHASTTDSEALMEQARRFVKGGEAA